MVLGMCSVFGTLTLRANLDGVTITRIYAKYWAFVTMVS